MNLADLTLDLADFAIGIQEYPITAFDAGTGTMTAAYLEGQTGKYGGATLWYFDGDGKCYMTTIERQSGKTIVVHNQPVTAPEKVFITQAKPFDMQRLASAVNQVLAIYPVMEVDTSLNAIDQQRAYTLPDGVHDVRRVEYVSGDEYIISHYWKITNGALEFYDAAPPSNALPMRVHYVKNHGRVSVPDGVVNPIINKEYVRLIAYLNLYRTQLSQRHKDNAIAGDLYNEGKMYEQILRDRQTGKLHLLIKDFTYAAV